MRMIVCPGIKKSVIRPEVYGNFAEHLGRCIYGGVYVGEGSPIPNVNGMRADVVNALKRISLPVLRWPGGCFADEYHWMDGIGEKSARKKMVNTNWGSVTEDNSFGTHEFMELCAQIGCKPYISGNVGSGTVREMKEWVEYITSPCVSPMADLRRANGRECPWELDYFGVGNENWGCGGSMRAEYYADVYRRYQTYARGYGAKRVYKIACGAGASISNPGYSWTETLMREAGGLMDGLSLHYYTVSGSDWQHKGSATEFDERAYYDTIRRAAFIDELLVKHGAIMDRYDPGKRVGLIVDEWGTWFDTEPGTNPGFLYQQNTMRDAIVAAITLNAFNRHSERVHMANIAQLINVLQALILTDGEKMLLTPTYHVFDIFKPHQGATLIESVTDAAKLEKCEESVDALSASASSDGDGRVCVTLANPSHINSTSIDLRIDGRAMRVSDARVLSGDMRAHNTFDAPGGVSPRALDGISARIDGGNTEVNFTLPPVSVAAVQFEQL